MVNFGSVEGPNESTADWTVDVSSIILENNQAVPSRPYRVVMSVKASSGLNDSSALDSLVVPPSISVKMHGPLQTADEPAPLADIR